MAKRKKKPVSLPSLRVDGHRRVNLKELRARREAASEARKAEPALSIEDTRVAEAWAREGRREGVAKVRKAQNARINRLRQVDGLKDGAIEFDTAVKFTTTRSETRSLRCRPGTFEWRYGRKTADASLYHAGIHYAELWEQAGTASASSPDWMTEGGSGAWKGLPNGRAVAMDKLRKAFSDLGRIPTVRLVAYCVHGESVSTIATRFGAQVRDMAAVLHQDLHAAAIHFRLIKVKE